VSDQALVVEVGRLELHIDLVRGARSRAHRSGDLRFLRTYGDRWCPLLSAVRLSGADPAHEEAAEVVVVDPPVGGILGNHAGIAHTGNVVVVHACPLDVEADDACL